MSADTDSVAVAAANDRWSRNVTRLLERLITIPERRIYEELGFWLDEDGLDDNTFSEVAGFIIKELVEGSNQEGIKIILDNLYRYGKIEDLDDDNGGKIVGDLLEYLLYYPDNMSVDTRSSILDFLSQFPDKTVDVLAAEDIVIWPEVIKELFKRRGS